MKNIYQLNTWPYTRYPIWLNYVRMALGIVIFIKGFLFIRDTETLLHLLRTTEYDLAALGVAHYIAFAHVFGGIFIALGLGTRVAVLFQLPVLIGAVFFVNASKGFFGVDSELSLSLAVLVFLLIFLICGSGKISLIQYIRNLREKQELN